MEFGVSGTCFPNHSWKDFLQIASRLGVEAVELDTRPGAHSNTWSPDLDPEFVATDLTGCGLRVGALAVSSDLVQEDDAALEREAEALRDVLDLAFRYRTEILHVAPQKPNPGMSREEMLASIERGCRQVLGHAENRAMLICLHNDGELLRDVNSFRRLIDETDSYNLRIALDVAEFLKSLHDTEAVREAVGALVPYVSHVCLRDARLGSSPGAVEEVPVGQGHCPVEMVVYEMMASSFYRPFFVSYYGEGDPVQSITQGIDYFRELPDRLLEEVGAF